MSILLVYATRHGATAGIAERIAALLTESDQPAEARPVEEVTSVNGYDAVVLGAAAYMFHWLKPAVKFARKHRAELVSRRVWAVQQRPARDGPDRQGRQERPAGAPAQGVRRAHRTRAPPRRAGLRSAHTTRAPNRSEGGNASSGTCRLLRTSCLPVTSGTRRRSNVGGCDRRGHRRRRPPVGVDVDAYVGRLRQAVGCCARSRALAGWRSAVMEGAGRYAAGGAQPPAASGVRA